jgi:hypothetical protein
MEINSTSSLNGPALQIIDEEPLASGQNRPHNFYLPWPEVRYLAIRRQFLTPSTILQLNMFKKLNGPFLEIANKKSGLT